MTVTLKQISFRMEQDAVVNTVEEERSQVDKNCDSCGLDFFINIVPVTRGTDGPCTTDNDRSAEVKQEHLPLVKQEAADVCYDTCHLVIYCNFHL